MAKITYDDKVTLNEQPSIANVNKVTDDDMNEIKSVVNTNDDNYTELIGNITGTVLWVNSSPTSGFAAQTVLLSSSDYDTLMFIFKRGANQNSLACPLIVMKSFGGLAISFSSTGAPIQRSFDYVDDTHYSFSDSTLSGATNNNTLVPYYIIGYKTGLFN